MLLTRTLDETLKKKKQIKKHNNSPKTVCFPQNLTDNYFIYLFCKIVS